MKYLPNRPVILSFLVFFSFLCLGCDKINFLKPQKTTSKVQPFQPIVKGTLIAKVNNLPITLEELNRYVDIYNASLDLRQDLTEEERKAAKIDTRDKKINYLKSMLIRQMVFYQLALDKGLDQKEEIIEILNRYKMALLAQEMQNEIVKNIDVSHSEIEEAYQNNKDLFREPEARRIREIVTRTEEEAKQILIELLQGQDFSTIARNRSIAESAKNGGDLGFLRKGERGEKYINFDEAAFSPLLKQGAISSVFDGPDGFYIVKIESIKEGRQLSLPDAWDTIKAILLARKQQDELDKVYSQLSRDTKIEIYEGEIK
ncbi:MAG: peptidyl-prolyl cis-trans isomerase [Candidatus Omnitrophica bacterium]|nr:peptidyl-prolyl cis-trans isomerase [Candidatus Omnitrophota bacterium]